MAIDRDEAEHIARLAMLGLSSEELDHLTGDLNAIVGHFAILAEEDVSGVEPCAPSPIPTTPEREDVILRSLTREEALRGAPDSEDGFFRLPRIIDGS